MYSMSKGIICKAFPGQSIENFASELIAIRKKELGVLVGVFNDIALFVHSTDTKQEIVKRYFEKRQ